MKKLMCIFFYYQIEMKSLKNGIVSTHLIKHFNTRHVLLKYFLLLLGNKKVHKIFEKNANYTRYC